MSKSSNHQKFITLIGWLEQMKKNNKYGKPKHVVLEEDIEIHFSHKKRKY